MGVWRHGELVWRRSDGPASERAPCCMLDLTMIAAAATWRRDWTSRVDALTQTDSTPHSDSRSPDNRLIETLERKKHLKRGKALKNSKKWRYCADDWLKHALIRSHANWKACMTWHFNCHIELKHFSKSQIFYMHYKSSNISETVLERNVGSLLVTANMKWYLIDKSHFQWNWVTLKSIVYCKPFHMQFFLHLYIIWQHFYWIRGFCGSSAIDELLVIIYTIPLQRYYQTDLQHWWSSV